MNNLNSVLIEGILKGRPELSYLPNGDAVCTFVIESSRSTKVKGKIQKEISSFDIQTSLRLAEVCAEYLHKGRGVRVFGRLDQETYFDDNGAERERMFIVAEHVEFKPQLKTKE